MFKGLKPFVPSDVCLKCDGCCRFKEEKSGWRPMAAAEERAGLKFFSATEDVFSRELVGNDERIVTAPCRSGYKCTFLNETDNTCRIYGERPFECQLYPFVISRRDNRLEISAHLSCPYVQKTWKMDPFNEYVDFLRQYFESPEAVNFLKRNPSFGNGGHAQAEELDPLFSVDISARPARAGGEWLAARPLLEAALDGTPHRTCAHALAALAAWDGFFRFHLREMEGALCVFATDTLGTFLFLPPLGKRPSTGVVQRCFDIMDELNGPSGKGYSRIENVPLDGLSAFSDEEFLHREKTHEYCYYRKDIVEFKGNAYKSQRSEYNQFVKNHSFEFLPFDAVMTTECLALFDTWAKERRESNENETYRQMLADSRTVHETAMRQTDLLGLTGRVVRVGGNIRAYTFGYPVGKKEFCVFLEIADLRVPGLPTFIFREFCADPALETYSFINGMDDFAMPNVQKTKMSFKPAVLKPVYTVTRKERRGSRRP